MLKILKGFLLALLVLISIFGCLGTEPTYKNIEPESIEKPKPKLEPVREETQSEELTRSDYKEFVRINKEMERMESELVGVDKLIDSHEKIKAILPINLNEKGNIIKDKRVEFVTSLKNLKSMSAKVRTKSDFEKMLKLYEDTMIKYKELTDAVIDYNNAWEKERKEAKKVAYVEFGFGTYMKNWDGDVNNDGIVATIYLHDIDGGNVKVDAIAVFTLYETGFFDDKKVMLGTWQTKITKYEGGFFGIEKRLGFDQELEDYISSKDYFFGELWVKVMTMDGRTFEAKTTVI